MVDLPRAEVIVDGVTGRDCIYRTGRHVSEADICPVAVPRDPRVKIVVMQFF
jgi:hypothetical protein